MGIVIISGVACSAPPIVSQNVTCHRFATEPRPQFVDAPSDEKGNQGVFLWLRDDPLVGADLNHGSFLTLPL